MSSFADVSQLEGLIERVISLVRLIVQDHVNVIAFARRRIFVWHVTFQVSAQIQFDVDSRAINGRMIRGRDDTQDGIRLVLFATLLYQVFDCLWPRYLCKYLFT